ncbi:SDR family oxidoreductase [Evansella cellulosilytica]|uniref:NAD-dependent epimerase/dehydratase n=1 Tax=Evansella cellulosilytica (strain ATCC 21833 / DSM 2522 / FERM P-1141 / JCM 9156 / N-4) TaxID=649639 RepID=E6U116_EVAC2|nr:SDR family oxidoreductase [Evansella cellulosilytica]ADU30328.1 NAD-dependent epimerase/dehydratase [Evansella cellulosilytica DSM 2522]
MKILVVGANGQIGKHLVTFLQQSEGMQAKAMIRNEQQADFFESKGAETVIVDLEQDIDPIANAAKDVDAIVFTAGSGPHTGKDKTIMVDLDGAVKTIEAAKLANVKRFIMISSFDTRRDAIQHAPASFAPYVAAKHYADDWLRRTDLDYTIIHPGGLTNEKGIGHVTVGEEVERGEIPREDVARVIVNCLENNATIGKEFQLITGSTPINKAIDEL